MGRLKTFIKNDLWHVNYIIPFTAKYLQYGKIGYLKRALPVITKVRVIKGKGKRDVSTDILELMKRIHLGVIEGSSFFYWIDEYKTIAVKGNVLSNFCIDYGRLVNSTFNEIAGKAIGVGGIYGERAKNIKKAVNVLRDRVIETMQAECNDTNRSQLTILEMNNLLDKPAAHLHEGLQRILFFNQYMWQTRHGLNGLGRLDLILGDLYQKDLKAGIINKESAYAMILDFMNTLNHWYVFKSSSILGDIGQIVILGGLNPDGTYFSNELTYLFIKAQAESKKPDPKTFLRVSNNMPQELMEVAVEALKSKTGSPLFSNDEVVIPQLTQFGFTKEEACSYCVSACWEPFIPGRSLDQNNIKAFDFFRPLDSALTNADLSKIKTFDEVVSLYENALRTEWKTFLKELDSYIWACDPFVSMLTDGCNESRKDISQGGARYNNYGVTSIGMGSVVDSLFNIKKLVYEDCRFSLEELNNMRNHNYKNQDSVYTVLQRSNKSYAHDDQDVEDFVNRIIGLSNSVVKKYRNPLGGKVKFGLSSPFYIRDAKHVPGDFAGRKDGSPYSTHISCLDAPYTEVVNFAGSLDYSGNAFNGNVVDFFVSPSFIESNKDKFVQFMRAAGQIGYFQMQMNVMDSKTLIDAKAHPEKYPGLIVRVWGFSAYFNDLPEDYKDVLIERAIESEGAA